MKLRSPFLFLTLAALSGLAAAAEVACPDLATVTQVASCPTEDELLFTFNGYCSDNARMYGKGAELCTDYRLYRQKKNIALWETADGRFHLCLLNDDELDIRAALRSGADTAAIGELLLRAVRHKPAGHLLAIGRSTEERSMHQIGG